MATTSTKQALAYCPGLSETREELRTLYARRAMDRVFAVMDVPSPAIARFARKYPDGYCEYPPPGERLAFWDEHLRRKRGIADHGVPAAYLSECDQGLYGGLVGGTPQYMAHPDNGWVSSMVAPVLGDRLGLEDLSMNLESEVFRRYRRQLEVFRRGARGKFGISHFILINGLNFLFELVGGTRSYLALFEQPDEVRAVMDFAFDLNVMVQDYFFDHTDAIEGGTCGNLAQWTEGRIVSESVDPFHMTSVGIFEEWGREPVERVFAHYDGGIVHLHGNGRHLLEAVASLRGLKAAWVGDDLGFPRAFSILSEVRRRVGDLPLIVYCRYEEMTEALRKAQLTGGTLYHVQGVPDADTANRLMDRVRAYRC